MSAPAGAVQRWDIYDIADELEDVLAQLQNGLVPGYDPIENLRQIIKRSWEAARLSATAAETLRDIRHDLWWQDEQARTDLQLSDAPQ